MSGRYDSNIETIKYYLVEQCRVVDKHDKLCAKRNKLVDKRNELIKKRDNAECTVKSLSAMMDTIQRGTLGREVTMTNGARSHVYYLWTDFEVLRLSFPPDSFNKSLDHSESVDNDSH